MNLADVERRIADFVNRKVEDRLFIYEFLKAYGMNEIIVSRLLANNGRLNVASNRGSGDVLYANKIFFHPVYHTNRLVEEFEQMKTSKDTLRRKPRFLVASDFNTFLAYDTKTEELLDVAVGELPLHCDFFTPLIGIEKKHIYSEVQADVDAANRMAELYDQLVKDNPTQTPQETHALNIFLTRLLFCYFAEDTAIFQEKNLFTNSIDSHTHDDGKDTAQYIERLFDILNVTNRLPDTPEYINKFPYVNGGLFKTKYPIPHFGKRSRRLLLSIGKLDWAEINPDIFGSMIQAVVSQKQRSVLGMHYTSVPNIMKVIEPLFLNELREEFEKRKAAKDVKALHLLAKRLWDIKVFDPACGSGNFLIIAYRELRRLEWDVLNVINELNNSNAAILSGIQLSQFYGIELDDFAHEVAILSLWLAEHQMNVAFQSPAPTLPLKASGNIVCGNATRIDWQKVCPRAEDEEVYVLGNPPYLGSRNQKDTHKKDMEFALAHTLKYKKLDYISVWFYLASRYISGTVSRSAFISTNSICQGEQTELLWGPIYKLNIEIYFAYTSFKWSNNAKSNAKITVVIIGLRNKSNEPKFLYRDELGVVNVKRVVNNISPSLTDESHNAITKKTNPISTFPEMRRGNMPNDNKLLRLSPYEKAELLKIHPQAAKFIRRTVGSDEYINSIERYCLWIKDEHVSEAMSIPFISDRVNKVRYYRANSNDKTLHSQANKPHQFREFFESNDKSIIIPIVSSERREYIPIGFMNEGDIIPNSAHVVYDGNPIIFGVLTSRMHMVWVRAVAGKLEERLRYSSQLCYNTFPFPEVDDRQRKEIKECVDGIRVARCYHGGKTLAQLYDPDTMPENLRNAHAKLDVVIESIYRNTPFENDEERLAHLFAMYEQMTKGKKDN